nr:MAG TPA: hypothetical protein [Caudoviricetes sp.]
MTLTPFAGVGVLFVFRGIVCCSPRVSGGEPLFL